MLSIKIKEKDKKKRKSILKKIKIKGKIIAGNEETDIFIVKDNFDEGQIEIIFKCSFDVNDDKVYEIIEYLFKALKEKK